MCYKKNFLGEEEYMILNATSGAGAPMMYYFSDSYVTGIKEDEPNTFLNGTKFKELFEKEGLNPKSSDKVNGKGSGQKFSIPNNKFMISADF